MPRTEILPDAPLCRCGCGRQVSLAKRAKREFRVFATHACYIKHRYATAGSSICSKCGATRRLKGNYYRCPACMSFSTRSTKYGLSREMFEAMMEDQKGECAICHRDIRQRFAVDHDHRTGAVRQLLCGSCNSGIGLFDDSYELLEKAVGYLKFWGGK